MDFSKVEITSNTEYPTPVPKLMLFGKSFSDDPATPKFSSDRLFAAVQFAGCCQPFFGFGQMQLTKLN